MAASEARLKALEDEPLKLDVIQAESRVAEAERQLEHDRLNLDRVRSLHEQGFRSDAQLEQAQFRFENAEQAHRAAGDYLEELKQGATEQELAAARRLGYTVDRAEGLEGIHCVAAPILDAHGAILAAVTIMAPVSRLPEENFPAAGEQCIAAARAIEAMLQA